MKACKFFTGGKRFIACFVIVVVVAAWYACGYGAEIQSFSAEQVAIDPSGKVLSAGKIYMTPKKIRMDFQPPEAEGTMINIFRRDRNLHWMLNPKEKKYLERPLSEEDMQTALKQHIGQTEKIIGTETVQGFKCTKKRVVTTVKYFGIARKSESTVWISKRLALPVRTKSDDGHMTELRKIKPGRQPSSLFDVPPGYKQVSNMMLLFGGSDRSETTGQGDAEEGKGKGSLFKIPEDIKKKLPKEFKWPFGGEKK